MFFPKGDPNFVYTYIRLPIGTDQRVTDSITNIVENKIIAVVGLGYVGLPLAVEFGKKFSTIGFDLSVAKVENYKNFIDSFEMNLVKRPNNLIGEVYRMQRLIK